MGALSKVLKRDGRQSTRIRLKDSRGDLVETVGDHRNQHFVPQFYLRGFSEDGASVSQFNIRCKKLFGASSIKGQCQKAFLYGEDQELEKKYTMMEEAAAPIIKDVIQSNRPPTQSNWQCADLMLFIAAQHFRTPRYAAEMNEMLNKMTRRMMESEAPGSTFRPGDLDGITLSWEQPFIDGFLLALDGYALLHDLRPLLFINKTSVGFVTSDHPTVFYNQLMEGRSPFSNTGIAQLGLQMFLPVSAHHLLCFYDPISYGVGRLRPDVINVSASEDVRQLNELQYVGAHHNIYFDKRFNIPVDVAQAFTRSAPKRLKQFAGVSEQKVTNDGRTARQLTYHSEDIKIGLRLSALKVLPRGRAKAECLGSSVGVRDEQLVAIHQHYRRLIEKGEYRAGQFLKFWGDHEHARISL